MFRYVTQLNLRDTDAAGVAFFAAYYAIAHDAYEAYLRQAGCPLSSWLAEVHLPIVHSEADYKAPLRLDDPLEVFVSCTRLGERSFTMSYDFISLQKQLARLHTVHVAVASSTDASQAVSLPSALREALEPLTLEGGESSQQ